MSTARGDHHWDAPRLAYAIAAAWCREVDALCRGDGGHLPAEPPPLGKLWADLDQDGQRDVITALGAQVRAAVYELADKHAAEHVDGRVEVHALHVDGAGWFLERMCQHARGAFAALVDPVSAAPADWTMPECSHCASMLALVLINLHAGILTGSGVADPPLLLEMLAEAAELTEPSR